MKTSIRTLVLVAVATLGVAACSDKEKTRELSEAEKQAMAQRYVDDSEAILEVLKTELPGIEDDDDLTKSIRVRNLIHHRNRIGVYTAPYGDLNQPLKNLEMTLKGEWKHSCGGMSFTWQTAMFALGIKTRYIGLADGLYAVRSHAEAELWLNGKWLAVDTTYNNMYVNAQGDFVSFLEMREMRDRGEPYFVEMNGQTPVDIWDPINSDVGMNTYLNLLAQFPAYDEPQVEKYFPSTWNGWVEVPGQGPQQMHMADFYDYLNRAYKIRAEME